MVVSYVLSRLMTVPLREAAIYSEKYERPSDIELQVAFQCLEEVARHSKRFQPILRQIIEILHQGVYITEEGVHDERFLTHAQRVKTLQLNNSRLHQGNESF